MDSNKIKSDQLKFFRSRKAGCIFAAVAARNPRFYGWNQLIIAPVREDIDRAIEAALNDQNTSTVSLIFPAVNSPSQLVALFSVLSSCTHVVLEQDIQEDNYRCLGFRVKVGNSLSWISGFGNFDFLPQTRMSPYTEIAFRVKPRPDYEWFMKPPIHGVVHLADMDMKGAAKRVFKKWWNASLSNTKKVLGHSPDRRSAAKTTYAVPITLFANDSISNI